MSFWAAKNADFKAYKKKKFSFSEFVSSFKESYLELIMPIGVLVGIYGGLVTPSEASALTAFYIFIIEFFVYKDLSLKRPLENYYESMTLVGAILLILCCALGITNWLVDEEVPMQIFELMRQYLDNKYSFLIFLNIFSINCWLHDGYIQCNHGCCSSNHPHCK